MSVHVAIVEGPVTAEHERAAPREVDRQGDAGAIVRFEGIVRKLEEGRALAGLSYQAYEPMAQRELDRLARESLTRHALMGLSVIHSRGRVPVGERSLVLVVRAAHRKEALRAIDEYIDLLKRDVPIWKQPIWEP